MAITVLCVTGKVLSYVYFEEIIERRIILTVLGMVGLFSLILEITHIVSISHYECYTKIKNISEIVLFGEDNNITDMWDIYGKTSIVFGKDEGENQVDINLKVADNLMVQVLTLVNLF